MTIHTHTHLLAVLTRTHGARTHTPKVVDAASLEASYVARQELLQELEDLRSSKRNLQAFWSLELRTLKEELREGSREAHMESQRTASLLQKKLDEDVGRKEVEEESRMRHEEKIRELEESLDKRSTEMEQQVAQITDLQQQLAEKIKEISAPSAPQAEPSEPDKPDGQHESHPGVVRGLSALRKKVHDVGGILRLRNALGLKWQIAATGVKWKSQGGSEPKTGRSLENSALAKALRQKVEFTKQEWEAFGIKDLRKDHFVKSGDLYFQPEPICSLDHFVKSGDSYCQPEPIMGRSLENSALAEALRHKTKLKNSALAEALRHKTELDDSALEKALRQKVEFTKQEWEAFGIKDLRTDHFVKSGDLYFQPADGGSLCLFPSLLSRMLYLIHAREHEWC